MGAQGQSVVIYFDLSIFLLTNLPSRTLPLYISSLSFGWGNLFYLIEICKVSPLNISVHSAHQIVLLILESHHYTNFKIVFYLVLSLTPFTRMEPMDTTDRDIHKSFINQWRYQQFTVFKQRTNTDIARM